MVPIKGKIESWSVNHDGKAANGWSYVSGWCELNFWIAIAGDMGKSVVASIGFATGDRAGKVYGSGRLSDRFSEFHGLCYGRGDVEPIAAWLIERTPGSEFAALLGMAVTDHVRLGLTGRVGSHDNDSLLDALRQNNESQQRDGREF